MKKTFILSDQSVNCYGFIVLTAGISLEGFKKNPVMLYNHVRSNDPAEVVGKWNDIRKEGVKLLGEPEFDIDDELGKKLSGKVEKGYINAPSISFNFNHEDLSLVQ